MSNKNRSMMIVVLLYSTILVVAISFPSAGLIPAIALLFFSFIIASLTVVKKHRRSYLQGRISHRMFLHNTTLEIFGILLAMTLAGLFGRYAAQAATAQIGHELTKLIAGIAIALLAGTSAGLLVKRTWGRLTKA